jgi:hypothetical protein
MLLPAIILETAPEDDGILLKYWNKLGSSLTISLVGNIPGF